MKTIQELFESKISDLNNSSAYKALEVTPEMYAKYEMKSFDLGKGEAYFLFEGTELIDCRMFKGSDDVSHMVASKEQMINLYNKYSKM